MAIALSLAVVCPLSSSAQQYIEIEPLFEYITAPDELQSLDEKSDYLVDHFWEKMDFKSKNAVDQSALNHAFKVYSAPLRFAEKNKASASVDKLIENLAKNPTLLLQFTKAAEENIFGPRSEAWIDEVYVKFLQALVKNKKVQQSRKEKYLKQLEMLEASTLGGKAPTFNFENIKGGESTYFQMATPTILIFADPTNTDWRLARLRLETNARLNMALEKGKVNVLFIIPDKMDRWKEEVANYPRHWTVGCGDNLGQKIDIRAMSSLYFASVWYVGSDGKIALKNVPVETAVEKALSDIN